MEALTIKAEPREAGSTKARALRREGNVPCILYGHHKDPIPFHVPERSLHPLIFTTEMHIVQLELNGDAWDCIMKDADFHPVTDTVIHADFQVLQAGEKVTLTVPLQYHGTPVGQKEGGDTQYVMTEVEIRCVPKDIPSHIDVDVSELAIGDSLHIGELSVEGVEFIAEPRRTMVTVVPPRLVEVEEEEVEEAELLEGEEVAEGEEGAAEAEAPAEEE